MLVEKPIIDNTCQLVFNEGAICRFFWVPLFSQNSIEIYGSSGSLGVSAFK